MFDKNVFTAGLVLIFQLADITVTNIRAGIKSVDENGEDIDFPIAVDTNFGTFFFKIDDHQVICQRDFIPGDYCQPMYACKKRKKCYNKPRYFTGGLGLLQYLRNYVVLKPTQKIHYIIDTPNGGTSSGFCDNVMRALEQGVELVLGVNFYQPNPPCIEIGPRPRDPLTLTRLHYRLKLSGENIGYIEQAPLDATSYLT